MTKDKLWAAYVAKNPQFANDEGNITLSAAGLRKLFSQTWEYGYDLGESETYPAAFEAGRAAERERIKAAGRAVLSGMPDFMRGTSPRNGGGS